RHGFGDPEEPREPAVPRIAVLTFDAGARFNGGDGGAAQYQQFRWNDAASVSGYLSERAGGAFVTFEPVALSSGLNPPAPEFLARLGEACQQSNCWFAADEGTTGLRFGYAGTPASRGAEPGIVILGESIAQGEEFGALLVRSALAGAATIGRAA